MCEAFDSLSLFYRHSDIKMTKKNIGTDDSR